MVALDVQGLVALRLAPEDARAQPRLGVRGWTLSDQHWDDSNEATTMRFEHPFSCQMRFPRIDDVQAVTEVQLAQLDLVSNTKNLFEKTNTKWGPAVWTSLENPTFKNKIVYVFQWLFQCNVGLNIHQPSQLIRAVNQAFSTQGI